MPYKLKTIQLIIEWGVLYLSQHCIHSNKIIFTFMHFTDAFNQGDLHCNRGIHFFQVMNSLGIESTTLTLLGTCSTV